jgi:hypothetical protein
LPEIAGIVLLILIANFVATLLAVLLRLLTILNTLRPVLGQIFTSRAGAANVCP